MNGSNRKTYTAAGLGLLAVLFVSSIMLSNLALDNMRLDLTEQKLYTMSGHPESNRQHPAAD